MFLSNNWNFAREPTDNAKYEAVNEFGEFDVLAYTTRTRRIFFVAAFFSMYVFPHF